MNPVEVITAVIPTSPLMINPSTEIIDETYNQLQKHLPGVRILLLMDGVHPEEQYMKDRYTGFKDAITKRGYRNFKAIEFPSWEHQSGMLREILLDDDVFVRTPLVFWSEHDIPLSDEFIDWQAIVDTLLDGELGGIRFELTGDPPKRDEIRGEINPHGIPLLLSTQYVNWPQAFRLDYFKEMISAFGNAKTYLECSERDGVVKQLWAKFKYGVYSPSPEIRRCYHTHARERNAPGLGKPYIEVDGHRRHVYGSYTPYEGNS